MRRPEPATRVRLRRAQPGDAAALAAMAAQLGYPTSGAALDARLAALHRGDAAVIVSTDAADLPTGWCHVELLRRLVEPLSALVVGLVVDEEHRSSGVGAALLAEAERWAADHGCERMVVATRITRERAHGFYAREGYAISKTSYFLDKTLG